MVNALSFKIIPNLPLKLSYVWKNSIELDPKAENHVTDLSYFIPVFGKLFLIFLYSINFHAVKCRYLVFICSIRLCKCFML